MTKTTYVRFVTIYHEANNVSLVALRTLSRHKVSCLFVEDFEDGFATVQPPIGTYIQDFADIIAGCLVKDSNFDFEVLNSYKHSVYETFKGIKLKFNNIIVPVMKENANPEVIYKIWEKEAETKAAENQKINLFQKSGRVSIIDELIYIDKTIQMEFRNEKAMKYWYDLVNSCSKNSIEKDTLTYACLWAKYMQKLIAKGKTVNEVAKDTSYICDIFDISVYMNLRASKILIAVWKYGDDLLKWFKSNQTLY